MNYCLQYSISRFWRLVHPIFWPNWTRPTAWTSSTWCQSYQTFFSPSLMLRLECYAFSSWYNTAKERSLPIRGAHERASAQTGSSLIRKYYIRLEMFTKGNTLAYLPDPQCIGIQCQPFLTFLSVIDAPGK